jgi:hypothetical protein
VDGRVPVVALRGVKYEEGGRFRWSACLSQWLDPLHHWIPLLLDPSTYGRGR